MDELSEMREFLEQQRLKITKEKARLDELLSPRDSVSSSMPIVEHPIITGGDKENVTYNQWNDDQNNPFKYYDRKVIFLNENNNTKSVKDDHRTRPESWQIKEHQKNLNETMGEPYIRENDIKRNSGADEAWANDAFYSYFPSFNISSQRRKQVLTQQRNDEYQNFLSQKTIAESDNERHLVRKSKRIEPKIKHYEEIIQKTSVVDNLLNSDSVLARNKKVVEDDRFKKMEYQKELVKQIEDKRKEIEALRKKEKEEEEKLTKKLEDQLRTVQLEEELEKQRLRGEQTQLAIEHNHMLRMELLNRLENDHKLYNPYDATRKSQSENGKDLQIKQKEESQPSLDKKGDKKVYKYFSNSARNYESTFQHSDGRQIRSLDLDPFPELPKERVVKITQNNELLPIRTIGLKHSNENVNPIPCHQCRTFCDFCHPTATRNQFSTDPLDNFYDTNDICYDCQRENSMLPCLFCHRRRLNSNFKSHSPPKQCTICATPFCSNCYSRGRQINSRQAITEKSISAIAYPKQPQIQNNVRSTSNDFPMKSTNFEDGVYRLAEEDSDDADVIQSGVVFKKTHNAPYSMNLSPHSIFNPDIQQPNQKLRVAVENGAVSVKRLTQFDADFEDLKRVSEEKIKKYAKNYGDLRRRRSKKIDELPIPLLSEKPPSTAAEKDLNENQISSQSENIRKLERKWSIPAVQKNTVVQTPSQQTTVTQVGAFKKELQLDQMEIE